ncbi:MAG: hypothetical protein FWE24_09155 [Defluviitaleaceae bacterium]|nr:hypothetical protein [Defluviitaleaceae bacterium]
MDMKKIYASIGLNADEFNRGIERAVKQSGEFESALIDAAENATVSMEDFVFSGEGVQSVFRERLLYVMKEAYT